MMNRLLSVLLMIVLFSGLSYAKPVDSIEKKKLEKIQIEIKQITGKKRGRIWMVSWENKGTSMCRVKQARNLKRSTWKNISSGHCREIYDYMIKNLDALSKLDASTRDGKNYYMSKYYGGLLEFAGFSFTVNLKTNSMCPIDGGKCVKPELDVASMLVDVIRSAIRRGLSEKK